MSPTRGTVTRDSSNEGNQDSLSFDDVKVDRRLANEPVKITLSFSSFATAEFTTNRPESAKLGKNVMSHARVYNQNRPRHHEREASQSSSLLFVQRLLTRYPKEACKSIMFITCPAGRSVFVSPKGGLHPLGRLISNGQIQTISS